MTKDDPPAEHTELITRIRGGDEAAFEVLFRTYHAPLCDFISARVESDEVAAELAQEVFISVWKRRLTLDPLKPIKGYLYRAARNRSLDHLKHRRVVARSHQEGAVLPGAQPPTPEESMRLNEITTAAQQAVNELPDRCRQIFLLSREGALSYAQIADLLEISIKTVETQMGRALKSLRTALKSYMT